MGDTLTRHLDKKSQRYNNRKKGKNQYLGAELTNGVFGLPPNEQKK